MIDEFEQFDIDRGIVRVSLLEIDPCSEWLLHPEDEDREPDCDLEPDDFGEQDDGC